ncbi:MAG: cytochrome family [Solirubrobacteraceae bacterium]|nr:cytochrome family [Solirubrobacteraceae bacterium]
MTAAATSMLLPPGPSAGPLAQTVALHRDPLGTLRRAQTRHGDVFTIRLLTARPIVVVAAPEEIGPLLNADPGAARGAVAGLFAPDEVDRRRAAIEAIGAEHAARWPRGRPFRLLPRMRTLVDDVFVRLVLGVSDDARARAITAALRRMLWTPGNPPVSLPGEGDGLLGVVATAAFERRQAPLARLLAAEIDERRRGPGGGAGTRTGTGAAHTGGDVIAAMARAEPDAPTDAMVEEVIALLLAAQEPPAAALTWLLDRITRAPDLAERFREPLAAGGERDPMRDAVVRESLRLRPAAIAALRRLTEPRHVAGHRLPAGVATMMPTPLLHRDARAFPEPDAFRPERWASGEAGHAAFMPFGGGSRRCLGEVLASAYIDCLIPAILGVVRLRPLWPEPERMVLRGTILVPHRSTPVVAGPARG